MSDLTNKDFPPLEPQPFVTEEGREIQRLRAELSKKIEELAAVREQLRLANIDQCNTEVELVSKTDELAAAIEERDGYLEGNRQTLRALEEANSIAARYKAERDEAYGLIRNWHDIVYVSHYGECMHAATDQHAIRMSDADRRAFLAATRKEGGGE